MQDGLIPPDASEGGSNTPSPSFFKKTFELKLQDLQKTAEAKGLKKVWNQIVAPWLNQNQNSAAKVIVASEPSADIAILERVASAASVDQPSSKRLPEVLDDFPAEARRKRES